MKPVISSRTGRMKVPGPNILVVEFESDELSAVHHPTHPFLSTIHSIHRQERVGRAELAVTIHLLRNFTSNSPQLATGSKETLYLFTGELSN